VGAPPGRPYCVIPKSEHPEALSFQPCRALGVRVRLPGMLPPVRLDNESPPEGHEIHNLSLFVRDAV